MHGMDKATPLQHETALLTVPQLCRRYKLSRTTISRAIKEGGLAVYSCGTTWPRVRVSDVESWITSTLIKRRNPDEDSSPKAAA